MSNHKIPITRSLTLDYGLSLVAGLLLAGVSLAGLLHQGDIYPTDELRQSFLANDVVNLFIGLPILVGSMWLTWHGSLVGLLFWPGALLYILYNYMAYLFGIPFSGISWLYLALILLSAFIIYDLLKSIDKQAVQAQLSGVVPVKIAGWVLVVFGGMFILRSIGIIAQAVMNRTTLPSSEIGLLVADLVLSTGCIAGGTMLLRRRPLGYVSGLGLLFAASMLFIGLIIFMLLQPVLTRAPVALVDVIVVLVMGMICFIPFMLFVRGAASKGKSS